MTNDNDLIRRGDVDAVLAEMWRKTSGDYALHLAEARKALAALPAVSDTATWNAAIRAAAEAMRPMLRSMVSRGDASDTILALLKPEVKS